MLRSLTIRLALSDVYVNLSCAPSASLPFNLSGMANQALDGLVGGLYGEAADNNDEQEKLENGVSNLHIELPASDQSPRSRQSWALELEDQENTALINFSKKSAQFRN